MNQGESLAGGLGDKVPHSSALIAVLGPEGHRLDNSNAQVTGPRYSSLSHAALRAIAVKAALGGAPQSGRDTPTSRQWWVSGSCTDPVGIDLYGRQERKNKVYTYTPGLTPVPLHVEVNVACRKCPACLSWRNSLWRARAQVEMAQAQRSWFGTLTLQPEKQQYAADLARMHLARSGVDFDALPSNDRFAYRHRFISKEITKYLKRVREYGSFRYLLVTEAHVSGLPHYHILMHEIGRPLRWKQLSRPWNWGYSQFKLVNDDPIAADYVTSYLSKSAQARVRASRGYGEAINDLSHNDRVVYPLGRVGDK